MANTLNVDRRKLRAQRFASQIIHVLQDFLPRDRATMDRVYHRLAEAAEQANMTIVELPAEWDQLTELEIRRAMIDQRFGEILTSKT